MSDKSRIGIGVGAVVFRGAEVLLIRRGKPPFQGSWSIPGGRVECGGRLEDAVRREVKEETAVDARITGMIGVFEALPSDVGDQAGHFVMVDYAAEWVAGNPVAGDDALDAVFLPIAIARERLSWDETRRALDLACKARR